MRKLSVIALVTLASQDAARTLLTGVILRKVRTSHPELFDGHAAALSVAACLAEYEAEQVASV